MTGTSGNVNNSNNNANNLNYLAAQQQQQQQQQRSSVRPNAAINRQNGLGINMQTNDFISFLNGNSGMNTINSQQTSTAASPNSNNALNRLETIRQYYMQLSNNLRLITQQLQSSELTASKRQALLMEQARANAAMQEFTEKILKPISASKQQQQQAQAQVQQQRSAFNPQQFQGRPSVTQHQPIVSTTPSSVPAPNFMQNSQTIPQGPQTQRPPAINSSFNLYSQSGLGMIRPILNTAAAPSGGNRLGTTTVNLRPTGGPLPSVPSAPQSIPPMPAGSPQRPFRPSTAVNLLNNQLSNNNNSNNNTNNNNGTNQLLQTSPPTNLIPPGTPKSQQQQLIVNRQTYLAAAQQHQNTVAQQQLLFQQRLSIFSRDSITTINSPSSTNTVKKKFKGNVKGAPVLALPPISQVNRPLSSLVRSKMQNFPTSTPKSSTTTTATSTNSSIPFSNSFNSKLTSFPSSYPIGPKLKDLAKQFKLELTDEAEEFLLRIADEFIDNLARKSILFASHRKRKLPVLASLQNAKSNKKPSISSEVVDEITTELSLTVEDLIMGLDEVINYQPAGNGSIENCRPLVKRAKDSTSTNSTSNSNNTDSSTMTTTSTTTATTNHQHRLTAVKKHSALYQNY